MNVSRRVYEEDVLVHHFLSVDLQVDDFSIFEDEFFW